MTSVLRWLLRRLAHLGKPGALVALWLAGLLDLVVWLAERHKLVV